MSELALLGGSKAKRKPFPLWPQYDDNEGGALRAPRLSNLSRLLPPITALAMELRSPTEPPHSKSRWLP